MRRAIEAGRWLSEAQEELRTAEWDLEGGRHAAACFSEQQAAETGLKAFLTWHTDRALYEHSLVALVRAAAGYDKVFAGLEEA